MRRLTEATIADKLDDTSEKDEKIILDLTHPDNLRAYFFTHQVMTRREESVESQLVTLVAIAMALLASSIAGVVALNSYFVQHQNASTFLHSAKTSTGDVFHQLLGRILSLQSVDLIVLLYILLLLFGSLIALSFLGSNYNHESKQLQREHLYQVTKLANFPIFQIFLTPNLFQVKLAATLELECDGWKDNKLSKARKSHLEKSSKLIESISKHFEKVAELGLFGLSYSSLYYYFVAFFSANLVALARKSIGV